MTYYAHSGTPGDKNDWQTLKDHSLAVAELAALLAEPLGLAKAAYVAGLLHDLGKYTLEFQQRLEGADISVDHSTAGARLALGDLAAGADKSIAELLSYIIAGHHAGLPDRLNDSAACLNRRVETTGNPPDNIWKTELDVKAHGLAPAFLANFRKADAAFQFSVMTRMIFSCLVDADFKDTERYYNALEGRQADRQWETLQALLPRFLPAFDAYMAGKSSRDTDLNRLRSDILSHVRGKATERPGLFTLTVPTGGGKTLASLAFALDHAKAHGHRRIIYAIPFTSIIDQTAAIFRSILGDDTVLEHHSAIDEEKFDPKERRESRDKLKLAMEDWAAPVVVTTNVQLFESLFAAKTSRARKLHNIAGSVIILDEAQTIPRPLLKPCIRMLDELALNYGCTIVLCTATQPALDARKLDGGLPLEGRELAPDPKGLAGKLRRARIVQAGPMNNASLIKALDAEPQALVIVNSRKHALELFQEAQAAGREGLVHLTTRQYAVHRRGILDDVRAALKGPNACRVIATSLIEAGVDVDFPKVWRAEAGLDSIIQAAGRVNREGTRLIEESIVTVFQTPDYVPPAEVRGLVADMQRMLARHDDLLSLEAIEDYFGEVYWRMGERLDGKNILPRFLLNRSGTDFAFRSVAQDFRMIESGMVPVIIKGDAVSEKAVDDLNYENIPSGLLARKLQAYVVQVPPKARDLLVRNGHVVFIRPDLRGDQFAVLQNRSLYKKDVGLVWEDAEYLAEESVSYDVMTPSAARGILEAIHWKPAIRWVIDAIHVLEPIRFQSIRRNEVGGKAPAGKIKSAMKRGDLEGLQLLVDEDRQQRAATVLVRPAYVIEAHFELTNKAGADDNEGKHLDTFNRRAERGQCFHQPCLGTREFAAHFELIAGDAALPKAIDESRDLGFILWDIDHQAKDRPSLFFRAALDKGVVKVPGPSSPEIRR